MDTMFQCFHLPDLTFQYGFGTQGQGPNDFVLPSITPVKYQKNGFVMLDGINLKHISVEKDKAIVQTSTLNYGFNCFNDLISISDSSYCCNGGFENEKEFRFLYPDGNHESWGEYPETEERFGSVLDRNQAYIKMTVAKPDKSCFVSFYQHIRRFRIYGKDGELKRDVILDILQGKNVLKWMII
ncbi:TolB-like 6-bladed beta-propeller domain-containing protein [Bacteroides fragilis]|nr:TolB-like 6-bladed beta-propeller domain-containing protein [Bacteroides fragilis]